MLYIVLGRHTLTSSCRTVPRLAPRISDFRSAILEGVLSDRVSCTCRQVNQSARTPPPMEEGRIVLKGIPF